MPTFTYRCKIPRFLGRTEDLITHIQRLWRALPTGAEQQPSLGEEAWAQQFAKASVPKQFFFPLGMLLPGENGDLWKCELGFIISSLVGLSHA